MDKDTLDSLIYLTEGVIEGCREDIEGLRKDKEYEVDSVEDLLSDKLDSNTLLLEAYREIKRLNGVIQENGG